LHFTHYAAIGIGFTMISKFAANAARHLMRVLGATHPPQNRKHRPPSGITAIAVFIMFFDTLPDASSTEFDYSNTGSDGPLR